MLWKYLSGFWNSTYLFRKIFLTKNSVKIMKNTFPIKYVYNKLFSKGIRFHQKSQKNKSRVIVTGILLMWVGNKDRKTGY